MGQDYLDILLTAAKNTRELAEMAGRRLTAFSEFDHDQERIRESMSSTLEKIAEASKKDFADITQKDKIWLLRIKLSGQVPNGTGTRTSNGAPEDLRIYLAKDYNEQLSLYLAQRNKRDPSAKIVDFDLYAHQVTPQQAATALTEAMPQAICEARQEGDLNIIIDKDDPWGLKRTYVHLATTRRIENRKAELQAQAVKQANDEFEQTQRNVLSSIS